MAEFPSLPLFTDAITADCAHLSDEEFGRYMRLLIIMWRSPMCRVPDDPNWLAKRLRVDALAYQLHIHPLMQEFCILDAGWWTQKRLQKEFVYVQGVRDKRRNAAISRWHKDDDIDNKRQSSMQMDMQMQSKRNAPTPTPTPTLEEDTKVSSMGKGSKSVVKKPDDVSKAVWDDFLTHRRAKKAPVTETVISRTRQEADKVGWSLEQAMIETCNRGWQGFKADYLHNNKKGGKNDRQRIADEAEQLLDEIRKGDGD